MVGSKGRDTWFHLAKHGTEKGVGSLSGGVSRERGFQSATYLLSGTTSGSGIEQWSEDGKDS